VGFCDAPTCGVTEGVHQLALKRIGQYMTMDEERKERLQVERSGAAETPEQQTYEMIVRTASRLEGELNRVLRPFELTGATYNILKILEAAGQAGKSCGDISDQLTAEVPDMTRLLDRLEKLGYIARARSSVDRRMVRVTLLEKGQSAVRELEPKVRECHARQLAHLEQDKLGELDSLLQLVLTKYSRGGKALRGLREPAAAKHIPH
jgi:DNA-binding MarR family transcriptional regulator